MEVANKDLYKRSELATDETRNTKTYHKENNSERDGSESEAPHDRFVSFRHRNDWQEDGTDQESHEEPSQMGYPRLSEHGLPEYGALPKLSTSEKQVTNV